jgi:hypothetical protein
MHKEEISINGKKTLFQISKNKDFADYADRSHNYDYVYRLVDIDGNLISEVDKFTADGYGFGTVVKMSVEHLEQLDKNIKKMVENAINDVGLSKDLTVNKKDNAEGIELKFEEDGVDLVVLVKILDNDAYVMVFDSMPNYMNYHFLFHGIHNFKNSDMHVNEIEKIDDKKNNFYFYFGDENTDTSFDDWLSEEAPKIHKVFRKLGITKEDSEE